MTNNRECSSCGKAFFCGPNSTKDHDRCYVCREEHKQHWKLPELQIPDELRAILSDPDAEPTEEQEAEIGRFLYGDRSSIEAFEECQGVMVRTRELIANPPRGGSLESPAKTEQSRARWADAPVEFAEMGGFARQNGEYIRRAE